MRSDKPAALFLFNASVNMPEPRHLAGYECHLVDISFSDEDLAKDDGYARHRADLTKLWLPPLRDYRFVCAFVPCTNTAVSGARWFKSKGPKALQWSLQCWNVAQELIEWTGAPGFIENPVSTFSTYCGKPDHTCHPHEFTLLEPGDNYTKKTCLWVFNGFRMPEPQKDETLGPPDDRIHKAPPGPNRNAVRSMTPRGFARAVFEVNHEQE